jgi:flavin reductase (DIM6/NTAB) family NADH-FMN oxidoreductase RutF
MGSAEESFVAIMGGLDPPMYLVTTVADGEPAGCLVGFGTQCSIHPPRFMVCLSEKNHTTRVAARADALAVHLLEPDGLALADLFGGETADEVDKFARCRWHPGPEGLPIVDACGRWFAGWIVERFPWGDHIGFVLDVFAAEHAGERRPALSFQQAKPLEPGHEP